MSAPSIGSTVVTKNPTLRFQKGSGWVVDWTWEGTEAALSEISLGNVLSVQRTGDGPIRTLVATYTADASGNIDPDQTELTWDFDYNDVEKPIWSQASDEWMAGFMKQLASDVESGDKDVDECLDLIGTNDGTEDDKEIFKLYQKGVDGYNYSVAVLKMTLVFDKYSTNTNVSYTNINRCYTLSSLLDENPSLLDEPVTLSEGYWLKKCPRTTRVSGGKYQLTQEWVFTDDYSTFLYGAPI